ncbi:MAG: hypothetical protein HYV90_00565 [Candidatus Woesebacteria bacterium]|nr:MAG: hypothetical protein HYV90_00565 [Candidatus Woesebacteria bacterium]
MESTEISLDSVARESSTDKELGPDVDERLNRYFKTPSEREMQILQINIGSDCVDWLTSSNHKLYVPDRPPFVKKITDQPSRTFFVVDHNWMLEIGISLPESNGEESRRVTLFFKSLDDTLNEWQERIDHPVTQIFRNKRKDSDYKKSSDVLQEGSLSFLKFCREVVKKIDTESRIYINPSDKQRARLYKKALGGQSNVTFLSDI